MPHSIKLLAVGLAAAFDATVAAENCIGKSAGLEVSECNAWQDVYDSTGGIDSDTMWWHLNFNFALLLLQALDGTTAAATGSTHARTCVCVPVCCVRCREQQATDVVLP
jgi:hypothetical protein